MEYAENLHEWLLDNMTETLEAPPLDPVYPSTLQEAASFIYEGENPVQTGVDPAAIVADRVFLIRGKINDRYGMGLPGVRISVVHHPEFGETFSRSDGTYDLVVNGGGVLAIAYEKEGYIPAQRVIESVWEQITCLDDITLLAYDSQPNPISLDNSEIQVARGSISADRDGERQATLILPAGTSAQIQREDGGTAPLSTATIRATEITIGEGGPEAMPAELPGNVGYTYAVDFSVDEVRGNESGQVSFDRPIYNYVENFIGFPVGGLVPAAYFDHEKSAWIPSENGLVIEVLAIENEMAQLDVKGIGSPATTEELAALGCDADELRQLAKLYSPGQSLWRVPITHFSTWDYNWPFGPPADACASGLTPLSDTPANTQILGRSMDIIGTPLNLYYSSERMPGYQTSLKIPLSKDTLPASLKAIRLEIQIAGQRITPPDFAPLPNQSYDFRWEGRDAYGRQVIGAQECYINIGYVYPGQYQSPSSSGRFGDFSGIPISADSERCEVILWQKMQVTIKPPSYILAAQNLGGWTLSPCHAFDPVNQILYLGYGPENSAKQIGAIIDSVGGSGYQPPTPEPTAGITEMTMQQSLPFDRGFSSFLPDETGSQRLTTREANSARKNYIADIVVDVDGTIYASDGVNNQIYRCTLPDHWELLAGTGQAGFSGDEGPALSASLNSPAFMDLAPDGSLLFADIGNNRVRKINRNGIITTVAGNGEATSSGDGGLALSAGITKPFAVSAAPDGSFYITETGSSRIRRVGPDGIISTVAGNGMKAITGDGGPAKAASVFQPLGIDVAPDGSVYFTEIVFEEKCGAVRRIRPDGIIETVAGQFGATYSGDSFIGDGGPAVNATIVFPYDLKVLDNGSFIISDYYLGRLRQVEPDGTIHTVAGKLAIGEWKNYKTDAGDGGPATFGSIAYPFGIDVAPDRTIYVSQSEYGDCMRSVKLFDFPSMEGTYHVPSPDGDEIFTFDAQGRHLGTYDAIGGVKKYEFIYDEQGLFQIIDRDGKVTELRRVAEQIIIDGYGKQTELQLDPAGYIGRAIDPMGYTTSYIYDDYGLLTSVSDKNNHQYKYEYNPQGRLIKSQQPDGAYIGLAGYSESRMSEVFVTTAMGKSSTSRAEEMADGDKISTVISSTGALSKVRKTTSGSITEIYEDGTVVTSQEGPDPRWGMAAPLIKKSSITTPGGLIKNSQYDVKVNLTNPSDPTSVQNMTITSTENGKVSTIDYRKGDGSSSSFITITTKSPEGRQAIESCNAKNRVVKREMTGLEPIYYDYESGLRAALLREVRQGERVTTYTYDNLDRLQTVSDIRGNTTSYTYNDNNQITSMTMPDGSRYQYHYDPNGLCDRIIMPSGAVHAMSYTLANLDESYTPPGNSAYVNYYDQDQYPIRLNLPSGKTIQTEYKPDGRPGSLAYDAARISLDYHGNTDVVKTLTRYPTGEDSPVFTAYTYDGSLLTSQITTGPGQSQFDYRYNNDLLLTGITLNQGAETVLQYDKDGLLIACGQFNIQRDGPAGSVSQISDGHLLTTFQYNHYGQLSQKNATVNGQPIYHLELGYDQNGRIQSKTETSGSEQHSYSYSYDNNSQLQTATRDGQPYESYQYDQNGNRTITWAAGEEQTAVYDQEDRLQKLGDTDYQFDQDGFLLRSGDTSYVYSAVGELLSTSSNGLQTTYNYDGTARRTARRDESGSTEYLYGNPDNDYEITAVRRSDGQIDEYCYDPTGILQCIKRDGQNYYAVCDHQGSPKIITDSSGNIIKELEYDSYGRLIADSNPDFTIVIGYAGGLDDKNGLIRFGARDYDPITGRWTAKDPILFEGGQANLYVYVGNDPVNNVDPEGTFAPALVLVPIGVKLSGEAIAVIAGVATAAILAANKDSINDEKSGPIGKEGRKNQGREVNEKKKQKNWKSNPNKNPNRPMKKHTPGRDHKKH